MAGPGFVPMLSSSPPPMDNAFDWDDDEDDAEDDVAPKTVAKPSQPSKPTSTPSLPLQAPLPDVVPSASVPPSTPPSVAPWESPSGFADEDDDEFGDFADFAPPEVPKLVSNDSVASDRWTSFSSSAPDSDPTGPDSPPPLRSGFTAIPNFDAATPAFSKPSASRQNLRLSQFDEKKPMSTNPFAVSIEEDDDVDVRPSSGRDAESVKAPDASSLADSGLCSDASPAPKSADESPDNGSYDVFGTAESNVETELHLETNGDNDEGKNEDEEALNVTIEGDIHDNPDVVDDVSTPKDKLVDGSISAEEHDGVDDHILDEIDAALGDAESNDRGVTNVDAGSTTNMTIAASLITRDDHSAASTSSTGRDPVTSEVNVDDDFDDFAAFETVESSWTSSAADVPEVPAQAATSETFVTLKESLKSSEINWDDDEDDEFRYDDVDVDDENVDDPKLVPALDFEDADDFNDFADFQSSDLDAGFSTAPSDGALATSDPPPVNDLRSFDERYQDSIQDDHLQSTEGVEPDDDDGFTAFYDAAPQGDEVDEPRLDVPPVGEASSFTDVQDPEEDEFADVAANQSSQETDVAVFRDTNDETNDFGDFADFKVDVDRTEDDDDFTAFRDVDDEDVEEWGAFDDSAAVEGDNFGAFETGDDNAEASSSVGGWAAFGGASKEEEDWSAAFPESSVDEETVSPTRKSSQSWSLPRSLSPTVISASLDGVFGADDGVRGLAFSFQAEDDDIQPGVIEGDTWHMGDGRDVLTKLIDIDTAFALSYHWLKTAMKNHLFWSIGVDSRNVVSFHKKQVPIFASSLGTTLLEPSKGGSQSPKSSPEPGSVTESSTAPPPPSLPPSMSSSVVVPSQTAPSQSSLPTPTLVQTSVGRGVSAREMIESSDSKPLDRPKKESIPPVEFDWKSSGLLNPLDASAETSLFDLDFFNATDSSTCDFITALEADILGPEGHSTTSANALESEMLETTTESTTPRSAGGLHPLLAKLQSSTSSAVTSSTSPSPVPVKNLSLEVQSLIDQLPNLSYMRAQVLMFPIRAATDDSQGGIVAGRDVDDGVLGSVPEDPHRATPPATLNTIS